MGASRKEHLEDYSEQQQLGKKDMLTNFYTAFSAEMKTVVGRGMEQKSHQVPKNMLTFQVPIGLASIVGTWMTPQVALATATGADAGAATTGAEATDLLGCVSTGACPRRRSGHGKEVVPAA